MPRRRYYAIIRTCIQTSIFVSTSSCTSSCQCGTSVSTSPCSPRADVPVKNDPQGSIFDGSYRPVSTCSSGVKVPDSNTMESDTALCTDEYTGTITTGTNVKCFAFNPSITSTVVPSTEGAGSWTWPATFGGGVDVAQLSNIKLLVPLIVPCLTVFVFRVLCLLLLLPDLSILQCMRQVHTILLHGHSLQPCRRCAICRFTVR